MSLASIRAASAKLLGPFLTGTATAGSSTTQLECTDWPFRSTLAQNDLYKDYYLMRPNAAAAGDVCRIVDTYTAGTGLFTVDQAYTNSPNGEAFELHGHPIEPSVQLKDMINEALRRMMVVTEVSFTPPSGDERYILSDFFNGVLDPRWVYQAGVLYSGELRRQTDPYVQHPIKGTAIKTEQNTFLDWGPRTFQGTELIYVRLIKSAWADCLGAGLGTTPITNATNATPIVITSPGHGIADNRNVFITGVGGNTNANDYWQIKLIDANTFSLNGSGGNAAYTSGGIVTAQFGQQNGLSAEGDTTIAGDNWTASAVAVIAWDRYGHLLEQTANQKIIRDAQKAAAWFNELTEYNFQEPIRTLQPIRSFGPPRYGWGWGW